MLYELMDLFIFFYYYYEKGGKKRFITWLQFSAIARRLAKLLVK